MQAKKIEKYIPALYLFYYSLLIHTIITEKFDKVLQTEIFLCDVCYNFLHRSNTKKREKAQRYN